MPHLPILSVHIRYYKWTVSNRTVNASVLRNITYVHIWVFAWVSCFTNNKKQNIFVRWHGIKPDTMVTLKLMQALRFIKVVAEQLNGLDYAFRKRQAKACVQGLKGILTHDD